MKKNPIQKIFSSSGSSITAVLIGSAMIGVTALTFMSLISQMNLETARLKHKLAANDHHAAIQGMIMTPQRCIENLGGAGRTYNLNNLARPRVSPAIEKLSYGPSATDPVLVETNKVVDGFSVTSIALRDWTEIAPNFYTARLTADLLSSTGKPLAPVRVGPVSISTDPASPTGAKPSRPAEHLQEGRISSLESLGSFLLSTAEQRGQMPSIRFGSEVTDIRDR